MHIPILSTSAYMGVCIYVCVCACIYIYIYISARIYTYFLVFGDKKMQITGNKHRYVEAQRLTEAFHLNCSLFRINPDFHEINININLFTWSKKCQDNLYHKLAIRWQDII